MLLRLCYNSNVEKERQGGFTIIEVMLVLAVSALLISTTVIGTYRMVFDARFKDVMTNTASWLQMQYEEARSGVRPSCDSNAIGMSDRVLLGKVIRFSDNSINSVIEAYPVIGRDDTGDNNYYYSGSIAGLEYAGVFNGVEVVTDCKSAKELDWQARTTNLFTYGNNGTGTNGFNTILLVRSPRSTNLKSYFGNTADETDLAIQISGTLQSSDAVGGFIKSAEGFEERGAVIIRNGDSNIFQSLGVVCIDPGANSTNVWGARGLGASEARAPLTGDSLRNIVGTVRAKCNE